MTDYAPPLDQIRFVLEHVTPIAELAALEPFAHAEPDLVAGLLEEVGRFAAEAVAPTNRDGDVTGARLEGGRVAMPESFKRVYGQYVEAGWGAVQHPPEFGGGGFPLTVANVVKELLTSANMAFSMGPLLTTGAVVLLQQYGSEQQLERYVPKMVSGEWTGTMCLTEPQAGSDVGATASRAEPAGDGTYRLFGQKIFITYGDHDLADNIVHLVLARLPDAPAGTKGISLFLVPTFLVEDDGSLGERNDVQVLGVEHKMGIHASPTCTMGFGESGDGAYAELVGEPHKGMRAMFAMMNDARLGVGLQGVSLAERATQQATAYARQRLQGRPPGGNAEVQVPIVEHPDVKRMLVTMRALTQATRALCYANAFALDRAHNAPDEAEREHQQKVADLLTPLSKAWSTDVGVEVTSLAVQVHGGMGYIEETGVAQLYRDARIPPIYEGTNGIQALDLVGRKLPYDGGAFVKGFIGELREHAEQLPEQLADLGASLTGGIDALQSATEWIFAHGGDWRDVFAGATEYLRMFAMVAGGHFLAVGAAAAQRLLDADEGDRDVLADQVATARFYATRVLPEVHGLLPRVTAGAEVLDAIPDDRV